MRISSVSLVSIVAVVAACSDDGAHQQPDASAPDAAVPDGPPAVDHCADLGVQPSALDAALPWHGTNRADLTSWLDAAGCASVGFDAAHKPLALFDWDNTISKNDFGDAITFYLIKHGKVRQPPGQDWHVTSGYMTDAAATALTVACGTTVPAGMPLPTDSTTDTACADEMLSIYIDGKTRAGADAFAGHNWRRIEPTYAWTAQLMAGYTHAELQAFMLEAVTPQLTAALGTKQTVGSRTDLNAALRIYDQSKDLITAAKTRGYDVWIITASPQDAIAALSAQAGIPADHVLGIRSMTDAAGKLLYTFEGCGPYADGQQSMITYIQGKRCFINKVIYGDTTPSAINRRADGHRQYFAAGDSDTDVEFLRDASYKLVLNRNKKELMCQAYNNEGDTWRINPMFLEPKPMQMTPYPCSTTACKDENGQPVPCRDMGGNIIPPQVDAVHP